jgi:hypothetical protein
MRVGTCEYRENRHSKNHTLPQDVSDVFPNFLYFPSDLKFDAGDIHKKYLVILSFVKIGAVKAMLYLGA